MTLTANKYKNMMIKNQWEAPSPHDATIQALESKVEKLQRELKRTPKVSQQKNPQKKKENENTKPQRPKWLINNENHRSDNNPALGYGMETNGTGVPRKQEVNVRDVGSATTHRVVKGKHSEVSTKRGHVRKHLNKRKPKRRTRGRKRTIMTKNESAIDSPPLSPLHTMKQTTQEKMKNEGGAERWADNILTFLSPVSHTFRNHLGLEVAHPWSIPIPTYTKMMCLSKRRSCMSCKTKGHKRKNCQV